MKVKKLYLIVFATVMCISLSACGKTETSNPVAEGPSIELTSSSQEDFTWSITVANSDVREVLHTDAGVPQYDGSILDVAYDNVPESGNEFVIVTMTIAKNKSGGSSFDWTNLSLVDGRGNSYSRMEDDTFLSVHTYNRIQGTTLQIGENKGSICFEIPKDTDMNGLKLVYDAGDEGLNTIYLY